MKGIIVAIIFSFLLASCAAGPYRTKIEAEQNRKNLAYLKSGMTRHEVLSLMGRPDKTERYEIDKKPIEFWFYLTEGTSIDDRALTDAHFTPIAFDNGTLKEWGRSFYDKTLRIKDVIIERK